MWLSGWALTHAPVGCQFDSWSIPVDVFLSQSLSPLSLNWWGRGGGTHILFWGFKKKRRETTLSIWNIKGFNTEYEMLGKSLKGLESRCQWLPLDLVQYHIPVAAIQRLGSCHNRLSQNWRDLRLHWKHSPPQPSQWQENGFHLSFTLSSLYCF